MADRTLDVTIVSAEDLKASCFGITQPYAVVWIDQHNRRTTPIDSDGRHNPSWNERFSFAVPEHVLRNRESSLHVEIYSKRSLFGKRLLGMAVIRLEELVQQSSTNEISMYQLRRRSGKMKGAVKLSVRMDEKAAAFPGAQHMSAYPNNDGMPGYGGHPQTYPPQQSYPPYPQGYPQQSYQPYSQGYPHQQPYQPYPQFQPYPSQGHFQQPYR